VTQHIPIRETDRTSLLWESVQGQFHALGSTDQSLPLSYSKYFTAIALNIKDLVRLVYPCCSHLEHISSVKRLVLLQFLNITYSVGLLGRANSQSQGRYLTQTQNKHRRTFMPRVGFESTIPAFEQAKTDHELDRAVTVIGKKIFFPLFGSHWSMGHSGNFLTCPSHPPWLDNSNYVWWWVQVMKLLIM
jgi:hypothetical protein